MLFFHTLLFFALGTSIVSCDSDGIMNRELQHPLEVPSISRYADEWHRKPLTVSRSFNAVSMCLT